MRQLRTNLRFCFSLTTSSLGTPCRLLLSSLTLRLTSCLEGQTAVTGLILRYLLVADDRRLLSQDGIVCARIAHLIRVSGFYMEIEDEISTSPNSSPSAG